ncbi:hypothetical protein CYMTET_4953 [Cymbomonas tetramitiformis]|uniref:PH domain-containing protein n=1 Tax=Cymbomonas tetramitiformis TaxID=36881 RepID=A0AAE0H0D6_9CHLO|nr:hypothetical protein CYMTET_4953 [Cymbomonas tetramitiformis]
MCIPQHYYQLIEYRHQVSLPLTSEIHQGGPNDLLTNTQRRSAHCDMKRRSRSSSLSLRRPSLRPSFLLPEDEYPPPPVSSLTDGTIAFTLQKQAPDKRWDERNIVLDLRNKRLLNLKKDVVHKAHSWEDIIHYQKMEDDQVKLTFCNNRDYKLRVIYQDDMKPLCRVLTLITRWRAARALNPNTSDAGPEAAAFTKLVLYAQRPTLICGSVYKVTGAGSVSLQMGSQKLKRWVMVIRGRLLFYRADSSRRCLRGRGEGLRCSQWTQEVPSEDERGVEGVMDPGGVFEDAERGWRGLQTQEVPSEDAERAEGGRSWTQEVPSEDAGEAEGGRLRDPGGAGRGRGEGLRGGGCGTQEVPSEDAERVEGVEVPGADAREDCRRCLCNKSMREREVQAVTSGKLLAGLECWFQQGTSCGNPAPSSVFQTPRLLRYPRSCVPLGDQVSSVQLVQQKIFVKVRSAGLNLELTGATEELVQLWCPEDWIDWHDAVVEAVQTELDEPPVTSPEAHVSASASHARSLPLPRSTPDTASQFTSSEQSAWPELPPECFFPSSTHTHTLDAQRLGILAMGTGFLCRITIASSLPAVSQPPAFPLCHSQQPSRCVIATSLPAVS